MAIRRVETSDVNALRIFPHQRQWMKSELKASFGCVMDCNKFLWLTVTGYSQYKEIEAECLTTKEYNDLAQRGKIDIAPFLAVDIDSGKVVGHEGRHRVMSALKENHDTTGVYVIFKRDRYTIHPGMSQWDRNPPVVPKFLRAQFGNELKAMPPPRLRKWLWDNVKLADGDTL